MEHSYDFSIGARRLKNVHPSAIRKVLERATILKNEGNPVIFLSIGEPDFNTPEDIKSATIQALTDNFTHYTSNRGYPGLRKTLQHYIKNETGVDYDPDSEIILTSGGAEGLNNTILSFVDPDDDVIVLTPSFVNYKSLVNMCEAHFVDVPLKDFRLDIEAIQASITPKTKMLIINNPNNPSGVVFTREELDAICKLARENNFLILSDEMYSQLVYGDSVFYSIANFSDMKERTILVSGFSKTFAMTGWRVGYIAAPKNLADVIMRTHQYSTTSGTTFIQVGLSEAMESKNTKQAVNLMVKTFSKRRDLIVKELSKIPELTYSKPDGAFYLLVDVSKLGLSGDEFAKVLLEKKYVATVPAKAFGDAYADYIRISYATSEDNIIEGVRRISELVQEIKR